MKTPSNEIKLSRVYDAPLKTVWDAWVDPKQAAAWWGPRGFTLTTHSKDFRVGGHWSYTMHGPDGKDWPNRTTYLEIVPLAKMVYDHGATDDQPPMFRVTVTFAEKKGKTYMDMTMALATAEAAENTRKFIKKAGGDGTWDRLAEYLEARDHGREVFVLNRSFDAPIEQLYDMWAKPEHLARWTGPAGSTMKFIRADIREGGSSFYSMDFAGQTMYGKVRYLQLRRPELLVYVQQFADKDERTARHPMAPTWPESMRTEVRLTAEGPSRTRISLTWSVEGQASPAELETFAKGRAGMSQGWGGSFDKLEEVLAADAAPASR